MDIVKSSLSRRLGAEALGTAMLVLVGAGSVVAALTMGDGELSYPGLGFIALAFAIVIALVVYGFGPVSGAHINPAVTVALAVTRRFAWSEVGPYVAVQLAGAVGGALVIVGVFGTDAVELGLGGTTLAAEVSVWQGIAAEAAATFILLFAVMALAVDARAPLGWAGLMIGLSVGAAILMVGALTGGSLNPARTFGPLLTVAMFGGTAQWGQFVVYCIGPVAGGVVAVLTYDLIAQSRAAEAAAEESYTPTSGEES